MAAAYAAITTSRLYLHQAMNLKARRIVTLIERQRLSSAASPKIKVLYCFEVPICMTTNITSAIIMYCTIDTIKWV
jgi:hypothetical protein